MLRFNALIWLPVSPSISLILVHLVPLKTLWSNLGELACTQTGVGETTQFSPLCCLRALACSGAFIDFAARMCVVALEGGQRRRPTKQGKICHLAAQNVYCGTQTRALRPTHTKNTHVINAASLTKGCVWSVYHRRMHNPGASQTNPRKWLEQWVHSGLQWRNILVTGGSGTDSNNDQSITSARLMVFKSRELSTMTYWQFPNRWRIESRLMSGRKLMLLSTRYTVSND